MSDAEAQTNALEGQVRSSATSSRERDRTVHLILRWRRTRGGRDSRDPRERDGRPRARRDDPLPPPAPRDPRPPPHRRGHAAMRFDAEALEIHVEALEAIEAVFLMRPPANWPDFCPRAPSICPARPRGHRRYPALRLRPDARRGPRPPSPGPHPRYDPVRAGRSSSIVPRNFRNFPPNFPTRWGKFWGENTEAWGKAAKQGSRPCLTGSSK